MEFRIDDQTTLEVRASLDDERPVVIEVHHPHDPITLQLTGLQALDLKRRLRGGGWQPIILNQAWVAYDPFSQRLMLVHYANPAHVLPMADNEVARLADVIDAILRD